MARKKSELEVELNKAEEAGQYMVAVWRIEGVELNLYRLTKGFPVSEFLPAIELLQRDLLKLEPQQTGAVVGEDG